MTAATAPQGVVPPSPTAPGPRRSSRPILLGVAVIGVILVGYFVYNALSGNNGASSPEAAVTRVTNAIDHQDPVGVLEAINPGEVHDVASVYSKLRNRVEKTGVKGKNPNVEAALFGLENVHFKNPSFQVDRLSPNVAKVTLVGGSLDWDAVPTTYDLTTDSYGEDLPTILQPQYTERRQREHRSASELSYTTTDDLDRTHVVQPFLMTVRHGGGWYVSVTYTVAEELVEALGLPPANFDSGKLGTSGAPISGSTPDDTIRGLAQAITNKDVYGGATYLSSDEAQATRDYAASFQEFITRNLAPDASVDIQLDNLHTSTHAAGHGLVRVNLESATGSIVTNDPDNGSTTENFSFDGTCLRDLSGENDPSCIARRFKELTGIDKVFVLMEHHGGRYTISPIATALEYLKLVENAAPDALVQRAIGAYSTASASGAVSPGTLTRATTNDAGFVVYTYAGTKNDQVSVLGQDDNENSLDVRLFAADGAPVPTADFSNSFFVLPTTGTYKLVLVGNDFEKRPIQFRLDKVEPTSMSVPGSQSASLEPFETSALQFDASGSSSRYSVSVTSGSSGAYSLLVGQGSPGDYSNCDPSCSVESGQYTLYLFGSSATEDVNVSITAASVGFSDGSTTESGTLSFDGDSQTFTLTTVPGESVTVTVNCGLSLDCTLANDQGDLPVDSALSGEPEELTFTPVYDTTQITVGSYSGSGDFELSVSS